MARRNCDHSRGSRLQMPITEKAKMDHVAASIRCITDSSHQVKRSSKLQRPSPRIEQVTQSRAALAQDSVRCGK